MPWEFPSNADVVESMDIRTGIALMDGIRNYQIPKRLTCRHHHDVQWGAFHGNKVCQCSFNIVKCSNREKKQEQEEKGQSAHQQSCSLHEL
jgi:hypothetical protein